MKTKNMFQPMLIAGLLLSLAVPAIAKEDQEEGQAVAWSDLPAAVQTTATANANGGTIGQAEKETKKGKVVYEVEVKGTDGKETELKIAEDGKLIKVKVEEEDDDKKDKEDKD